MNISKAFGSCKGIYTRYRSYWPSMRFSGYWELRGIWHREHDREIVGRSGAGAELAFTCEELLKINCRLLSCEAWVS